MHDVDCYCCCCCCCCCCYCYCCCCCCCYCYYCNCWQWCCCFCCRRDCFYNHYHLHYFQISLSYPFLLCKVLFSKFVLLNSSRIMTHNLSSILWGYFTCQRIIVVNIGAFKIDSLQTYYVYQMKLRFSRLSEAAEASKKNSCLAFKKHSLNTFTLQFLRKTS